MGRVLHAHAVARARAAHRARLIGITAEPVPDGADAPAPLGAGAAFATVMGARAALREARSRLDVTAVDQARLDALAAAARTRAAGYRPVRWGGSTPEEFLDDVARLFSRLNTDAPTGDLAWEAEYADAAEIRRMDEATGARGRSARHSAAVHTDTGRVVAWTTLMMQPDVPWHAWQSITIVDPAHRGHRLGLLVKVANLRYARDHHPALSAVDTFNAAENGHMIAINEAMGFRRVDGWIQWQQDL